MAENIFLNYLQILAWPLIAAALLLIGYLLGIAAGKSRVRSQLEGELQDTKDALEWEQAHFKELMEKSERELAKMKQEMALELESSDDEKLKLLRKEVQRLYAVLQKSWLSETQNERRIRHLEATLSNLSKRSDSKIKQTELEL